MGKDFTEALDSTLEERQYDQAAKRLLQNKEILAHILSNTIDEYKGKNPEDIVAMIEGTPYIDVPVAPGLTNVKKEINGQRIVGMNGENHEMNEGLIRFDVIFYMLTPDGKNKIIINVEAQKRENPGYPIVNRAIFYACREISSEKERDFSKSNYQDIRKTYSIWICMDSQENCMNHIHLTNDVIIGNHKWNGNLDLINIIMIGVDDSCVPLPEESEFYRFLCALFADPKKVPLMERSEILNNEYSVWNDDIRKEVENMCNLSQAIAERNLKKGLEEGEIKGVIRANKKHGISEEETLHEILEDYSLSMEDAQKYIQMYWNM